MKTKTCPICQGAGQLDGGNCSPPYKCDNCNGTGRIKDTSDDYKDEE